MFRNVLRRLARSGIAARLLKRVRALGNSAIRRVRGYRSRESSFQLPIVPRDRRIATLGLVENVLDSLGIDHRSCVTEANVYCAVSEQDLQALCEALNQLGRESGTRSVHVWLGRGLSFDKFAFADTLSFSDVEPCDSIVVTVPFRAGRLRIGRSGGVEILVIDQHGSRHVARQQWADEVDWTLQFDRPSNPHGQSPSRAGSKTGNLKWHALEDEPIDVVYTWVDSEDPAWRGSMQEWAKQQDVHLDSACNEQRYVNRDELRYSLRSVTLYAPFVRNIFLVTAGHCPRWLNRTHDNVHVITHGEIFPSADDLPTFNSHAIETCLHRIPGLSENFLYFNDDVFLKCETTLSTYFTKMGLIKSRFSKTASVPLTRPDMTSTPTDWASYNAAILIGRDFGIRFDRKMQHIPMAMKRSVLHEIEHRYADLVAETRGARFRSPSDLAVTGSLAHFYGISLGKAVEWEYGPGEYEYIDTGWADFETRLARMADSEATFVCLNATRHSDVPLDRQNILLRQFFDAFYPIPSPYESTREHP